jgi:hypothetical protein
VISGYGTLDAGSGFCGQPSRVGEIGRVNYRYPMLVGPIQCCNLQWKCRGIESGAGVTGRLAQAQGVHSGYSHRITASTTRFELGSVSGEPDRPTEPKTY